MNENEKFVVPNAQIEEKPDGYVLKVSLSGVGREDADLRVEDRTLVLKTHAACRPPEGVRPVSLEFERVNYAMSADLPEMADTSTLSAKLENGILTVTVRKRPETQARQIAIG